MSIPDKTSDGAGLFPEAPSSKLRDALDGLATRRPRRSMVTRTPEAGRWFRRRVLKRTPVLYHLETRIVEHCNPECAEPDALSRICRPELVDADEFAADMGHMARIFSDVRHVYLTGGEPLLHPRAGDFCKAVRASFPKARIYLKTNGTLVMQMGEEFWADLLATKTTLLCEPCPGAPALEIGLLGKQRGVRVQFVSPPEATAFPADPRGRHDAAESFRRCQGIDNRPILRRGHLYPCAHIAYAEEIREQMGHGGLMVYPTDSIGIREEPDPEQVFEFLRNPVHWCTNCDWDLR